MPRKKKPKPLEVVNPPLETLTPTPPPPAPPETEIPEAPPRIIVPRVTIEQTVEVLRELAARNIEGLSLYEPIPLAQEFHRCTASERIVRGSNRAGKTLSTHVELARALLGKDPFDKYPKHNGRAFLVGYRGKEVGEVNYRKLFRGDAFKIIRDPDTKEWRAFRPWQEWDAANAHLKRAAPPLIPPRYVSSIAWENKKENIPSVIRLTTGWELNMFSSQGDPPTGSDIDLAVFDEEIENPNWYPEISSRLTDRRGKFIWGATPQAGTEQLYDLCLAADDQKYELEPRIVEFMMTLADNPHIPDAAKKELALKFADPLQYQTRIGGEFAIISFKFYPEFHESIHGIKSFPLQKDWTRYAIIDPGHQPCSILFIVAPPPDSEYAGRKIAYDELVIPNCNAVIFGQEMAKRCKGQDFHEFIIDSRGGRITDIASGLNVELQYAAALKANGVKSAVTGHGFSWGSDLHDAGSLAVRQWLQIGADAKPTFYYFKDVLKVFKRQMERYHYGKTKDGVTDKPVKKNDHMCLVAGTMIQTERGDVPIEGVKVGDMVWTREGLRRVIASGMTAESASVSRVETENGEVVGTGNHPVYVAGKGFAEIDNLRYGDTLLVCEQNPSLNSSFSMESSFADTRIPSDEPIGFTSHRTMPTELGASNDSTKKSGCRLTAPFPRGCTSTTRTITPSTMPLTISNVSRLKSIGSGIPANLLANVPSILNGFVRWPQLGIEATKEGRGIVKTPEKCRLQCPAWNWSASDAINRSTQRSLPDTEPVFARMLAKPPKGVHPESITLSADARSAIPPILSADTRKPSIVRAAVLRVVTLPNPQAVYNITVEGDHEYFANGVLVSNCDNIRYAASHGCRYVKPRPMKQAKSYAVKAIEKKKKDAKARKGEAGEVIRLGPGSS